MVLSIDDFYHSHDGQARLALRNPSNPLVQHRGQPSTHDLPLALSVLSALRERRKCSIPAYDKSAFSGKGDRVPLDDWQIVNDTGEEEIEVVIFEGWCVGFRALSDIELQGHWESAVRQRNEEEYKGRLGWNSLESIRYINEALRDYDEITE